MKRKILLTLAALGLGGLVLGVAPAVLAAPTSQICSSGTALCYNAWNGGILVKTEAPGPQNNNFDMVVLGHTTAGNPIPGVPAGLAIVDFPYLNVSGECVTDNTNDPNDAKMGVTPGTCNGVGWGSRFVLDGSGCPAGFFKMINVHWSGNWATRAGVSWSGSGNGNQIFLNTPNTGKCLTPR